MNFLYLTHARHAHALQRDGSTRYRCFNYAEALLNARHVAQVQHIDEVKISCLDQFDVVVFLRPQLNKRSLDVLNACTQKSLTAIADYDDLIFLPDIAEQSPAVRCGQSSAALVRRQFTNNRKMLENFSFISVASNALQTQLKQLFPDKQVLYLPNTLSAYWLERNRHINTSTRVAQQLIYMPGSRSHDADFKALQPTLAELMRKLPSVTLKLYGKLNRDSRMLDENRVLTHPNWIEFDNLPGHIAAGFAALAPLENNAFNQCKSHIKFLEAAAFGTPLLASENEEMLQHSVDGLMFPDGPADWIEKVEKLTNRDYFVHCSESLMHYVRARCRTSIQLPALLNFIGSEQKKCAPC